MACSYQLDPNTYFLLLSCKLRFDFKPFDFFFREFKLSEFEFRIRIVMVRTLTTNITSRCINKAIFMYKNLIFFYLTRSLSLYSCLIILYYVEIYYFRKTSLQTKVLLNTIIKHRGRNIVL